MTKQNQVSGFIWLLLGALLCIGSIQLNLGGFHKPGPGFMPFLTGAILVLLGFILMFSGSNGSKVEEGFGVKRFWREKNWKNVLIPWLSLFGYLLLLQPLGFLPTSFLFLFLLFKLTKPESWLEPFLFSGATVVLTYFIFSVWLRCPFPKGMLAFLTR
jgi:putative tricarboxylic transport membrane protein